MKYSKFFQVFVIALMLVMSACTNLASTTVAPKEPIVDTKPTAVLEATPTEVPIEPIQTQPTETPAALAETDGNLQEITIDAADFSYTAPETISSGWVRVILTNSGQEPHHVQFLRLNDGVKVDQFSAALEQGEGPALTLTKQVGGVGAIAPGGNAQAILRLTEGEYVILCFIPSPSDQVAHHEKGMIKSLSVQASRSNASNEPKADITVRMKDFNFTLPDVLPVGRITIEVVNEGPEPHEFNILRLAEGKTLQDVVNFLTAPDGPPPFIPVGGMNGLDKSLYGYLEYDFQPGNYVAICNIPSPKAQGHPHSLLGMIQPFTVADLSNVPYPTGKFADLNNPSISYMFNEDGTFAFYSGDTLVVQGTYSVDGNIFSLVNPNETEESCKNPGTYLWSFDGTNLKLTQFGIDTCKPRRDSFLTTFELVN